MVQTMFDKLQDAYDTVASYVVAVLGLVSNVDWLHIGAYVLLCVRLINDVPPAYDYLKAKLLALKEKYRGK